MKKKNLVVYHWKKGYKHGYGNVDCTVKGDVFGMKEIRDIERQICEAHYYESVVLLNIIELAEESEVAKRREVSENNTVRCFHPSVTESQREAERREDIEKSPVDSLTPSVTDSKGDTE